jgi:hypothetical protein
MEPTETDRKGRNEEVDFHGQKRSQPPRPGKEAKLTFMGHAMTENRNGPVVEEHAIIDARFSSYIHRF